MTTSAEALLDQALSGETRALRRQAFVDLVASEDWRLVLAPHVISQQGYELRDGFYPDWNTFHQAAPAIAASEEKIQRVLELLGSRFSDEICEALARHMGQDLVELVLDHLRTAKGERALLLQQVIHQADRGWVRLSEARRVIRQRLRLPDRSRLQLMNWLADAGNLTDFIEELKEHPPTNTEEWNALGRGGVLDESLINYAMASLGSGPEPLAYLLRLDPVPEHVLLRTLSAARPDWLVHGLEVAIICGQYHPVLIPLAELGVRLGGRPMAAAMAWVGSARLGKELLKLLASFIERKDGRTHLSDMLWVQRRAVSSNRALEEGRKGLVPHPMDAAALVRQLRGEKVTELVHEILDKPRSNLLDSVLRPLCGVNLEAASEVIALCKSPNLEVAHGAREARAWPDVAWPEEILLEVE